MMKLYKVMSPKTIVFINFIELNPKRMLNPKKKIIGEEIKIKWLDLKKSIRSEFKFLELKIINIIKYNNAPTIIIILLKKFVGSINPYIITEKTI